MNWIEISLHLTDYCEDDFALFQDECAINILEIPFSFWEDLGRPQILTVTIEPRKMLCV